MRLFAFVNESTRVTNDQITAIAEACTIQLCRHVCPTWHLPTIVCFPRKFEQIQGIDFIPRLVFFDDPDVANALGYHSVGPDGLPYAKVFTNPILDNGGGVLLGDLSVAVTASHEACETAGDEHANEWRHDAAAGNDVALELADPVQGCSYNIMTRFGVVSVSDFVTPAYFIDGPGKYDYLGKLDAPWSIAPGGYQIVRDASGAVRNVFGQSRQGYHPASRLARRGG